MQLVSVIPFVAVLVASAFMAVSIAWSSARRATGAMTAIFACGGAWALLDLLSQLESEPERAIFWLEMMHLPILILGVCVVWLLADIVPALADRLRPLIPVGLAAALVLGCAALVVPGVITGVTRTAWGGWMPRYGVLAPGLILLSCVLPVLAAYRSWRAAPRSVDESERTRSQGLTLVVLVSLVAALSTDYVLPLLEIPFPRLGAPVGVLAAALIWLRVLHLSDDLAVTPEGAARAVLAELHDGVALVELDGRILSSNPRLAAMTGFRSSQLMGARLSDLVDAPLAQVREGVEDREASLGTASGGRMPVSLSSSCVGEWSGDVDWFVVVFRDLRDVEALRRRVLTSGRLAAIGELAAGIAHEVNNPVAFVQSDLNFLKRRLEEIHADFAKYQTAGSELALFENGAARIEAALDGVGRVAQVVGDVRSFAHLGTDRSAAGDLETILEGAVRLARLERREDVRLCLADVDASIRVQSGQELKQVLLALLRVLTVGSRTGASVVVDLAREPSALRIGLLAEDLEELARVHIERFEMASEDALDASPADLGLAIAIEMADQLGNAIRVEARAEHALRIELVWRLEVEDPE